MQLLLLVFPTESDFICIGELLTLGTEDGKMNKSTVPCIPAKKICCHEEQTVQADGEDMFGAEERQKKWWFCVNSCISISVSERTKTVTLYQSAIAICRCFENRLTCVKVQNQHYKQSRFFYLQKDPLLHLSAESEYVATTHKIRKKKNGPFCAIGPW